MISFASQSGSNKLFAIVLVVDVNQSGIKGEEHEISQNETEKNHVASWSAENLHDEANYVLPTVDEYDRFYDFGNDDVDYDDDTEEEMHENEPT